MIRMQVVAQRPTSSSTGRMQPSCSLRQRTPISATALERGGHISSTQRLGPAHAAASTAADTSVRQAAPLRAPGASQPVSIGTARVRRGKGRRPIPLDVKPGASSDAQHFEPDASVRTWGSLGKPYQGSRPKSFAELLRIIAQTAASGDLQTAGYWANHMARFGFFAGQTTGSLQAYNVLSKVLPAPLMGLEAHGSFEDVTGPLLAGYARDFEGTLTEQLWECYGAWVQDLAWIKAGVYKMPWDMVTPIKQYNPLTLVQHSVTFVAEGSKFANRKLSSTPDNVWLQGKMYPQYYKTFHYQTDGWLSDTSASAYEFGTEALFSGRQDAMQRSALVPISDYIRSRNTPLASMRLLEVAAGTGRFHTFIKDNWPELPTVCSDLSPFYLQQARSNMQEWKHMRQPTKRLGCVDDTGVEYVQMAAERLDMPDASVDIVVCVYLFHELPEAIRRKAVAEMYRVLKPGGLCVFADSVQRGDRPEYDDIIHRLGELNEPYQVQYVTTDLGAMFKEAGFEPQTKYLSGVTKTLSFIKPLKKPYDNKSPYFQ